MPGRIIAINGAVATVDFWGVRREVRLDIIDQPAAVGDYVLNHVGFAIRRIPREAVAETLSLYEVLLADDTGDVMSADVKGEIAAAGAAGPAKRR